MKDFGAVGDGLADDTRAIQRALDSCSHVFFPSGTYILRRTPAGNALQLNDRRGLVLDGPAATLRMAHGEIAAGHSKMLMLLGCHDIVINDLCFDGNRDNRPQPFQGRSHCVDIRGGSHVQLNRVQVLNSTYDGIHVRAMQEAADATYPTDITLNAVRVINAYRNGLTVSSVHRMSILDGHYSGTRGTLPQAGIDLEPDDADLFGVTDIVIERVRFDANAGVGLSVTGSDHSRTSRVRIAGITGRGNAGGLVFVGAADGVSVDGLAVESDPTDFDALGLVFVSSVAHDVSLRNLDFRDITGVAPSRALVHIHSGGSGFRVDNVAARNVSCGLLNIRSSCSTTRIFAEDVRGDACMTFANGTHTVSGIVARRVRGHVIHALAPHLTIQDVSISDCGDVLPPIRILSPASVLRHIEISRSTGVPPGVSALVYERTASIGVLEDFHAHAVTGADYSASNAIILPARIAGAVVKRVRPSPFH